MRWKPIKVMFNLPGDDCSSVERRTYHLNIVPSIYFYSGIYWLVRRALTLAACNLRGLSWTDSTFLTAGRDSGITGAELPCESAGERVIALVARPRGVSSPAKRHRSWEDREGPPSKRQLPQEAAEACSESDVTSYGNLSGSVSLIPTKPRKPQTQCSQVADLLYPPSTHTDSR